MAVMNERMFKTVKALQQLDGKDELSHIDICSLLGLKLGRVYLAAHFDNYEDMKPLKKGDIFRTDDGFKRVLLDDYGNGRLRLSCTNQTRHKNMHKQGKCYLSTIWTREQIKNNGYWR